MCCELALFLRMQVSAMHMRIIDGVGTLLQMQGMCCKLAGIARDSPMGAVRGGAASAVAAPSSSAAAAGAGR